MGSFFCDNATIEDDDLVGVFYVSHAVGDYQDGDAWLSFSYWSLSGKLPDVNSKEPENTAEYSAPQILPPTTPMLPACICDRITRAAESLHIAQPSLSKQMMELEQELGKPLLIRGKRKIISLRPLSP